MGVQQLSVQFGIGATARTSQPFGLHLPRGEHAGRNLVGSFGGGWQNQISRTDSLYLNMQVNPVEQWA